MNLGGNLGENLGEKTRNFVTQCYVYLAGPDERVEERAEQSNALI